MVSPSGGSHSRTRSWEGRSSGASAASRSRTREKTIPIIIGRWGSAAGSARTRQPSCGSRPWPASAWHPSPPSTRSRGTSGASWPGASATQCCPGTWDEATWHHPVVAEHFGDLRAGLETVVVRLDELADEFAGARHLTSHGDACPNNLLRREGDEGFEMLQEEEALAAQGRVGDDVRARLDRWARQRVGIARYALDVLTRTDPAP